MSFFLSFLFLNLLFGAAFCWGEVFQSSYMLFVVRGNGSEAGEMEFQCELGAANFGHSFNEAEATSACVFKPDPIHACTHVTPFMPRRVAPWCSVAQLKYAMVQTSSSQNCSPDAQAYSVQTAGYTGMLLYDDLKPGGSFEPHGGGQFSSNVNISVFGLPTKCGRLLSNKFLSNKGYYIMIRVYYGLDISRYLIPFVVVLAVCFLVMFSAMSIRCFRDRRRRQRRRLPRSQLKKLPCRKFKKGEEPDVCPICLEDYADGDKIRELPCKHLYHPECIDPWLTKNRKVCPVCKRKVFPNDNDTDSDSEGTADASGPSVSGESSGVSTQQPTGSRDQSSSVGELSPLLEHAHDAIALAGTRDQHRPADPNPATVPTVVITTPPRGPVAARGSSSSSDSDLRVASKSSKRNRKRRKPSRKQSADPASGIDNPNYRQDSDEGKKTVPEYGRQRHHTGGRTKPLARPNFADDDSAFEVGNSYIGSMASSVSPPPEFASPVPVPPEEQFDIVHSDDIPFESSNNNNNHTFENV